METISSAGVHIAATIRIEGAKYVQVPNFDVGFGWGNSQHTGSGTYMMISHSEPDDKGAEFRVQSCGLEVEHVGPGTRSLGLKEGCKVLELRAWEWD